MSTFQIFECVDFSPLPNRTSGSSAHTRQFNNDGHWPLAIPEYSKLGRWFNLTMDRSFGQCSGQMHYRRQTVNGGGCKIGEANGPLRCSLPLPRWKRGWLNGTRPFIFLSHFLSRMPGASLSLSPSLSLSLSLSLWKFARFWVWSILNIERLRMIYVAWPDGNSEQEMRAIFQLRCFFQIRLPLCNWAELRVKSYRLVWLLFASEIYSNDLNNWINFCSFPIRSPLFICSSSFLEHFLTY